MLKTILTLTLISACALMSVQVNADQTPTAKSNKTATPTAKAIKEKVSYGLGVEVAEKFKNEGIQADPELLIKGLKDGLSGDKLLFPEEELRVIMSAFRHEVMLRKISMADHNKKAAEAFLAENKKKDGVLTLSDGLQYKILKAGNGKKPAHADAVQCNFKGTRADGTELDKSEPGKPATFKVNQVIPGWSEALQLMPAGSRWQLFIPPKLAYGEKGVDQRIGPNEVLIFDVELLSVNKSENHE